MAIPNVSALEVLSRANKPKILVLGDLMLDRYTFGDVERVSPEAPVLVLSQRSDEVRPGGGANVAMLLKGLDCVPILTGVIGDDADGRTLRQTLVEAQVDDTGVFTLNDRPTTCKHRFAGSAASKSPQQILRVDYESKSPISRADATRIRDFVAGAILDCDAVLISDYAKGSVSSWLASEVIELCRKLDCPVLVDPSRDSDWSAYRHATLISPNRRAAEFVIKQSLSNADDVMDAATVLRHRLDLQASVITLDRDGIAFATDETAEIIPCRPREVCDVTGAGDMVLATLGFCATTRLPYRESLRMANAAAGLEVERFGVQVVTRQEIAGELDRDNQTKLVSAFELSNLCANYRRARRRIVFTNGCFDLLHVGHITLLQEAAAMGDILVVAVNSDASIRKLKGNERPIIGQDNRARMLAALTSVDHVVIFDDDTPCRLLELLRPDVLVKGGTTAQIVGREIVEQYGGQICRASHVPGISTTNLVQRFREPGKASATSLMAVAE